MLWKSHILGTSRKAIVPIRNEYSSTQISGQVLVKRQLDNNTARIVTYAMYAIHSAYHMQETIWTSPKANVHIDYWWLAICQSRQLGHQHVERENTGLIQTQSNASQIT